MRERDRESRDDGGIGFGNSAREREREEEGGKENEMDGLSTGNGFDHSFQRRGGGCSGVRSQQVQGGHRNLNGIATKLVMQ